MSWNKLSRRDFVLAPPSAAALAILAGSTAHAEDEQKADSPPVTPMDLVDPELRAALKAVPSFKITGELNKTQLDMLRAIAIPSRPLPEPAVVEKMVPGRNGAPEVKVFVINAKAGEKRPAILHMHGGGYILGNAGVDIPNLQGMAKALGCVLVTVDYRLAPETPFPGSLEDNYAALTWMHANAETLGVDRSRIALAGESAGGGHAAMLAIAARDRGEVPVLFQSLVYPMLDDRTGSSRPTPPHIGSFVWTADYNRVGWKALLGKEPGGADAPAGAVPSRVDNLTGLPPAWIGTGSIDLFVDENIEYARRLVNAGVSTELLVVPGAYHAFDRLVPNASASQRFVLSRFNALARAFGLPEFDSVPGS